MIQKPGSSTATCSCNVLVQKMILSIPSHGGFTVLWIHNFLLTLDPLITSLEFLINLPWCRHGYFLEPSIGSKCTFTFNKAVLTVSFVGKIPCIVTIVRIVVLCFLVFIIKCCSCPRWAEFGYPVSNQNNVIFPTLTSNLNQNILIPYM